MSIWESNWLKESFKQKIKDKIIVNKVKLDEVRGKPIKRDEFSIFPKGYY